MLLANCTVLHTESDIFSHTNSVPLLDHPQICLTMTSMLSPYFRIIYSCKIVCKWLRFRNKPLLSIKLKRTCVLSLDFISAAICCIPLFPSISFPKIGYNTPDVVIIMLETTSPSCFLESASATRFAAPGLIRFQNQNPRVWLSIYDNLGLSLADGLSKANFVGPIESQNVDPKSNASTFAPPNK